MNKHKAKSEEETKEAILEKINTRKEANQITIESAMKRGKKAGIEVRLHDIASIVEVKLSELEQQFQEEGLNLYSNSLVSQAIMQQLNGYLVRGEEILQEYNELLTPTYSQETKADPESGSLIEKNQSGFRSILDKIVHFYEKHAPKIKKVTPEARQEALMRLKWYKNLERLGRTYSVGDNLLPNLVRIICPNGQMKTLEGAIPGIVYGEIVPMLRKLDLEDLIPQLEEKIIEEYGKSGIDIKPFFEEHKKNGTKSGKESNLVSIRDDKKTESPTQEGIVTEGIEPGDD